jgi:acyl dehydratase
MQADPKHGAQLTALKPGDFESYSVTLGDKDIQAFADVINSHHPIHESDSFDTPMGPGRLVHGLMLAALVSRAITAFAVRHELKGVMSASQSKFVAPARAGDTLTVTLTYLGLVPGKPRLRCGTQVVNQHGAVVMVGEVQEHVFEEAAA